MREPDLSFDTRCTCDDGMYEHQRQSDRDDDDDDNGLDKRVQASNKARSRRSSA